MFIVWLAKTTDRIIVFVSSVAEPVFFWDLASGLLKFLQLRLLVQHFSVICLKSFNKSELKKSDSFWTIKPGSWAALVPQHLLF